MAELIETLHKQHGEIARIVDRVNRALAHEDAAAIGTALDTLAVAVLAHLEVEDSQLYPALTRAAEQNAGRGARKIARTYEHNMQTISVALKAFLEKYSRSFTIEEFRRDWALVCQLLTDRIASEEATLYPLYLSWVRSAKNLSH